MKTIHLVRSTVIAAFSWLQSLLRRKHPAPRGDLPDTEGATLASKKIRQSTIFSFPCLRTTPSRAGLIQCSTFSTAGTSR